MQKWEYKTILFELVGGQWLLDEVDGEEVSEKSKMLVYLNELGDQGWELVSEHRFPEWNYHTRIFWAYAEGEDSKSYMKENYPRFDPTKFDVISLESILDSFGADRWEVIHMQPIAGLEDEGRVTFQGSMPLSSNKYFTVMKQSTDKYISMRFKRAKE